MSFRMNCMVFCVGVAALVGNAQADDKAGSVNARRFAGLKKLAGDWVEVGKDGKPTDKLVSSIRLTAAGSVVQETLFPGTDHEMVTMYHLDGSDLVLTHYCILGNQPRMRVEQGGSPTELAFKFVSSTNLKSDDERHMNEATLTLVDDDHFRARWLSCEEGKECHRVEFNLVRKPKS